MSSPTVTADEALVALFSDAQVRTNPYPTYRQLRELAPVHRSTILPVWVVTRYDDCDAALRDPQFGKSDEAQGIFGSANHNADREVPIISRHAMLRMNPPDHTRLRGLVARKFTPRRIERLRPAITTMVDEILDQLAHGGGGDAMDVVAFPLPVKVIGELLGVPDTDREQFRWIVRAAAAALESMTSPDVITRAERASETINGYFGSLIADRRKHPSDDLIGALIGVRDGGDRVSEDELIATIVLLFAAGFETTINLIGNGLLALLRHRDQMSRLRDQPALGHSAIEEVLRYESSVQLDARTALETTAIAGRRVEAGDVVLTLLGAANRDPGPDRFDITRTATPHLGFAAGIASDETAGSSEHTPHPPRRRPRRRHPRRRRLRAQHHRPPPRRAAARWRPEPPRLDEDRRHSARRRVAADVDHLVEPGDRLLDAARDFRRQGGGVRGFGVDRDVHRRPRRSCPRGDRGTWLALTARQ